MKYEPQKEHDWLKKLIGKWTFETEFSMGPDKPNQKLTGTEIVTGLGALWVICEGQGEMPGGGVGHMRMTLGYDPAKKKYVGNWVGSMMPNMFVYEGTLDETGKILPLETTGPDFNDQSKISPYQDVIEWVDDDTRLLRSRTPGPDGQWNEFMKATYKRVK